MAYPKSVPPIKSLYQLILEDIEKPPTEIRWIAFNNIMVITA
jgi:hypothetical protein